MQAIVDALTAVGDAVSPHEHMDVILEGLPEEYESTISLISSKSGLLTIDEVATWLLAHQARLEKFQKKAIALANTAEATIFDTLIFGSPSGGFS